MRIVLQRVTAAKVTVDGRVTGQIGRGLLVLLGVTHGDLSADAEYLADKLLSLRIFSGDTGKMNSSLQEAGGNILVVSQFTLYSDCSRGRRPSFDRAAPAAQAKELYEIFVQAVRRHLPHAQTGEFGAHMLVELTNDGPVTLILDSAG